MIDTETVPVHLSC